MQLLTGGIAFFDSGIGGLTVLSSAKKTLPNQLFYYYGDNARAPYGNLTREKIMQYVTEAFDTFQSLKVKVAVLACNTATAVCAETLRKKYSFPIIGAEPAVVPAAKRGGNILVLSTRATFQSERFRQLCKNAQKRYANANITAKACDELAGVIEKNLHNSRFDYTPYLPKPDKRYTTVVLGCTHYIYIKEAIKNYYGCETVDGNVGIANRLRFILDLHSFKEKNNQSRDGQQLVTSPLNSVIKNEFSVMEKERLDAPVFFLGPQKQKNKGIYEQMFANLYK